MSNSERATTVVDRELLCRRIRESVLHLPPDLRDLFIEAHYRNRPWRDLLLRYGNDELLLMENLRQAELQFRRHLEAQ